MISVVLYGRNDSYGYNLHKRAALSLNCMAEVMTNDSDEILFVDYNTPDDYPTFPEAIADTLTDKAKRLIRIFRVRPEIHEKLFSSRTHLIALEPISRNVAIRRANPANKWILSTNTDMVFVPRAGLSLSDEIAKLEDGFYCTPRMEIPESLWEQFDRKDPVGVIEKVRSLGWDFHLNEIVRGSDEILYDGPGDFQLILREDLFRIHGFHEGMLLGWHVDSNISKRLSLIYGAVGNAAPFVFGYHCDHTRQITPAHSHSSPTNDCNVFFYNVSSPYIPEQKEYWGLASSLIEEIDLKEASSQIYFEALKQVLATPLSQPLQSIYRTDSYNKESATAEHILPFLLDLFVTMPREMILTWLGARDKIFDMFSKCWTDLGFHNEIIVASLENDIYTAIGSANVVVVNFGVPNAATGPAAKDIICEYRTAVLNEKHRISLGFKPRRFIAVNSIHNEFEGLVIKHFSCARTPFSARLRHGFLMAETTEISIIEELKLLGFKGLLEKWKRWIREAYNDPRSSAI